jgi:hypothetical protein
VDDYGFWPTTPESLGVNAWIALDDIPVAFGGGFALASGSHTAPWRMEAHESIGSPLTYPEGGFKDGTLRTVCMARLASSDQSFCVYHFVAVTVY